MSDDDEEAPPLLNALTAAKSSYILDEVGRVVADELWIWRSPLRYSVRDMPDPGSVAEADLAKQAETHLLGVLKDKGLLVVRAAADPTDAAPLLLRRLRAFVLALLRAGALPAKVHHRGGMVADSHPSLQTDPVHAFAFPTAILPESCEALVKDAIKRAVVQALGLGAADPLLNLLASPMALHISEAEILLAESEVDEGGDIGDSSDDDEEDEDDEDEDEDEGYDESEESDGGGV